MRYFIFIIFLFLFFTSYADDKTVIAERIAPVGKVQTTTQSAIVAVVPSLSLEEQLKIGQKIYQKRCSYCHASGSAGAPKVSNTADWQKRYEQGFAILVQHVTKGYRMMPPKGTCMSCSQQDLQAAVKYMLQLSGVKERKENASN